MRGRRADPSPPVEPPGPDVEHLKMVQDVITRLAGNSFLIKGWMITLTAGLTALAKSGNNASFAWIAVGAAVVFSLMDASYLARERAYRRLYDTIRCRADPQYAMGAPTTGGDVAAAWFSPTVGPLYVVAAAGAVLVALFA